MNNKFQYFTGHPESLSVNSSDSVVTKSKNEVSEISAYDSNYSGSLKSCDFTPKFTPVNKSFRNKNRGLDERSIQKKRINKNELSELKKIELEFVKEMDSARSDQSNSRNKNETTITKRNSAITLLDLEILTETININSKGNKNTEKSLIEEILMTFDRLNKTNSMVDKNKNMCLIECYKKWFLEYNKISNELMNAYNYGNDNAINHQYFLKLNEESLKIMRSLIYYYSHLSELYIKERKNNKKQHNHNVILKKDNIKLSHTLKSLQDNRINKQDEIKKTISKQILVQICNYDRIDKVNVLIGTDENIGTAKSDIDMNAITNIDSINEVSMLRTGRHQDAHNYREGILKITQEYNGLYDRTRNEYIERLLEKQKNHDIEMKLILSSHKEDIDKINEYFIEEKKKIIETHDKQINELLRENKRKIDTLKSDHSLELRLVEQRCKQIISDNEKEKNNSIQAFKMKFEHILIDMEGNKNRELLNMQIKYEDKVTELKEYYKNIISELELELQRKELFHQDEKKMIVDEFVYAHKREMEQVKNQSAIKLQGRSIELNNAENESLSNNIKDIVIVTPISDTDEKCDQYENIDQNNMKYREISKRLDNITLRSSSSTAVSNEKSVANMDKINNVIVATSSNNALTTSSSSTIPSNNIFINN